MNWTIKPYESVGPLSLGESREAVREKLGSAYDSFEKVPGANPTDAYDDLGAHLYFDSNDKLEFAEFFEPAEVTFEGIKLLERSAEEVATALANYDASPKPSDVGYEYDSLGVALTIADGRIEGVGVYRQGYYD